MRRSVDSDSHQRAVPLIVACVAASVWLVSGQPTSSREDAYRQNNLGVARLEQYDYQAAAAAFQRALEIASDLTMARLNLAIALLYDGKLDVADKEAQAVRERMPSAPQSSYVVGLIARAANRPADAMAAFRRVMELDPEDVGSRVQLGQLMISAGQFSDASAMFEGALKREPFNATAAYGRAVALIRGGQRVEGEAAMALFQKLRDNPAAVTYSTTYLEQGRHGEAIASTGLETELVEKGVPDVSFRDVTSAMLGKDEPRGAPVLFDADGDRDLDLLVVSADGLRLLSNDRGHFTTRRLSETRAAGSTAAVAGDYDNDGHPDLLVIGRGETLYRQEPDGTFREVTLPNREPGATPLRSTAAFVDVDHDGDLDVVVAPPLRILRNNGNGSFADVTKEAAVASSAEMIAIVPTDYDNRRDIDLLLVPANGAPLLFANQRDGTFRDVVSEVKLPLSASYTAAATADINKDGAPDFFFARKGTSGVFALSNGRGAFTVTPAPDKTSDAAAARLIDYDNDGLVDLLAFTPSGPRLWRNIGTSWIDVTQHAFAEPLAMDGETPVALSMGDLDGDGDTDAIVQYPAGRLRAWSNEGGTRRASMSVQLVARVSNRTALGAKIELRAGSLRDRIETSAATPPVSPADVLFGLGSRSRADVIRVLWPSGILQAETDPGVDASAKKVVTEGAPTHTMVRIEELDRKPSSCPFLYTWNGSRFEFVTDFMGGGEMGYWTAPGVRNVPDPDEYVRIRGDQLKARDGRYELRVTNELEEAVFLDRLQLIAVEHPSDVSVYPNEGLRSREQRQPFMLYTTRDLRLPRRVVDDHGHDVLDRISAIDRRYPDDFHLAPIQGYAEEHSLTLDLGEAPATAPVRLLLTGWTDYAFSSDNVAAHQAGLEFRPPSLEIRDAGGTWRTVIKELGLPIGRPQTVVADLTPFVSRIRGNIEVRIATTLRVYWDQILMDSSAPASIVTTRLDPVDARLRWRGFSIEVAPGGRAPFSYDYDSVTASSPWKTMPGRYTREGDVKPLLVATDDQFVVSAPGDEIALAFDAAALPPVRDGWTRTLLLYADGFSKEMNLHSSSPDRLDPLPFHAMSAYPYPSTEHYPSTPEHDRYRATYNTRVIGGPVPPVETAGRREAPVRASAYDRR
jgi:tetratricopeptide (TPR) repeat protein